MRTLGLVPASLIFLTTAGAQAALKLTYERKKAGDEASTSTSTITVDGDRIRMEGVGGGRRGPREGGAMILDAAAKKIVMLDGERKVYREVTEADAKEMKERMAGMRAQMAEQMKNLPPEQRKHAEQAMGRFGGGGAPPEVKYEPVGTKKKVAGFACEVYKVKIGDRADESCFAPWSSNVVTKAEAAQFKKLAAEIEKSFSFLPGMRFADWSKAPGIPVEQTSFGADGKPESTNTLKSVTRAAAPASDFQVPAGYTKEEMGPRGPGGRGPGGMRGPGGGPPPGAPPK